MPRDNIGCAQLRNEEISMPTTASTPSASQKPVKANWNMDCVNTDELISKLKTDKKNFEKYEVEYVVKRDKLNLAITL
jgi:hypothetical protein